MKQALVHLAFALATIPTAAFAAFSFTEIMYDAPGTDTKHEWVEVVNDGAPVDLSTYKLFENGTNHGFAHVSGPATVGGYAIVADDATTFLADYPSYTGTLYDSAFSLSNTGESLTLRDGSLVAVATVEYSSGSGAAGDGNSLNIVGGSWVPRTPSPGMGAASGQTIVEETVSVSTQSSPADSSAASTEPEKRITVEAGADKTVVVGAGSVFSASAFGTKGEPLTAARYVWNFGNGASKEGQSILFAYTIPGTYVVTVDASSGGLSATDRMLVSAVPADVVVARASPQFIELENRSAHELDVGLWQVGVGHNVFVLPARTIVLPQKSIALASETTGLTPQSAAEVALYYPNGVRALAASPEAALVTAPTATHTTRSQPAIIAAPPPTQPSVLGVRTAETELAAETEARDLRELTDTVGEVSEGWALISLILLTLFVAIGVAGVLYLQGRP